MLPDNNEQVIINPRQIARHYIGTWFFLDLISSIPLDYIFLIFNSIRGSDVSAPLSHARPFMASRVKGRLRQEGKLNKFGYFNFPTRF